MLNVFRLVLVTVGLSITGCAYQGPSEKPPVLIGTISTVDEANGRFGIKFNKRVSGSSSIAVEEVIFTGVPKIVSNGKPLRLGSVQQGSNVILSQSPDGSPVMDVFSSEPGLAFLKASECRSLGGSVESSSSCPLVDQADGSRTRTTCESNCSILWYWGCSYSCIDEAEQ